MLPTFTDLVVQFLGILLLRAGVLCLWVKCEETHFFSCPTEGHRELSAAVRVKCDLLFEFHLASLTAADLITAHCVHTHKTHHHAAQQTTDADPFVSSNCYPSQLKALAVILTAVCRTDGRCIRFHGRFVFLRASGLHAMFDITRASVHAASYPDNGG